MYLPAGSGPRPGLLVGHGGGSRRQRHASFCRVAAAYGMAVLAFDFRGHGESEGMVDGRLPDDVVAAARVLREHPSVDPARIGYRGSSLGGYNGLMAAERAGLDALALLCPADEEVLLHALDRLEAEGQAAPSDPGGWNDGMRIDFAASRRAIETEGLLEAAGRLRCPVLLLHARADEVVPVDVTLRVAKALRGTAEVLVVPDGDHRSLQGSPEIHQRVAGWLSRQLSPGASLDS